MIWVLMVSGAIAASVFGIAFLVMSIGKFGFFKKIGKENKFLKILLPLVVVVGVFGFFSYAMSVINAVVIIVYIRIFFLLSELLAKIVSKISGKKFSHYWQGLLAIVCSVFYLVCGYYLCVNVVEKDYNLITDKKVGTLKIAMFADSHIGAVFNGESFARQLKVIEKQSPDILIIPGDYVKKKKKKSDMEACCRALGEFKARFGVYFAYGNHDEGYFNKRDFSAEDLRESLSKNGVHILEDEAMLVDNRFYVVGRCDKSKIDRMSMDELLQNVDNDKYIVVLDHEPNDYENEALSDADLVVSGHTHGGQLIPITYIGQWLGFNDRTYGYEKRNKTDFIVTSGISDWAIKFKTGCRSEYVIINVNSLAD